MIRIENGRITTVVVSSIMGHGGDGIGLLMVYPRYMSFVNYVLNTETSVIVKSATRHKYVGNFVDTRPWTWKYVQLFEDKSAPPGYTKAILNAYKLTNDGIRVSAKMIHRASNKGFNVIPSIALEIDKDESMMLRELRESIDICGSILGYHFIVVEIDASCGNLGVNLDENTERIVTATQMLVETFPELEFIIKLSPLHSFQLAKKLAEFGVILHSANSFPFYAFYPPSEVKIRSPLHSVGGGSLSGPLIFTKLYKHNVGLSQAVDCRMIFGGGVPSPEDAQKYLALKKNGKCVSVSISSIVRLDVAQARKIIQLNKD